MRKARAAAPHLYPPSSRVPALHKTAFTPLIDYIVFANAVVVLLTADEVALQLRVTRAAVYLLVRDGVLPAVHVGRRIRVAERVLANFIEAGGSAWPGGWRKNDGRAVRA